MLRRLGVLQKIRFCGTPGELRPPEFAKVAANVQLRNQSVRKIKMSSTPQAHGDGKPQLNPKIQIYTSSNDQVSDFWKEKYERNAKNYWDKFYKVHQDKFFKDRHYLDKEWGHFFSGDEGRAVLEVGCGAGNTVFPLLTAFPNIFVHACDFSPRAVNLVKMREDFTEDKVNAFVCDLTVDDLSLSIPASSVDIVTMIFVLSAVSPGKMPIVLQNIRNVLKPNGVILFRDYATGDLAQERFTGKEQKISENFYVRGDGTRAFYFSDDFLESLFVENGFIMKNHFVYCKRVENRSKELVMNRRWVQAVFQNSEWNSILTATPETEASHLADFSKTRHEADEVEIALSDGVASQMFGFSSSDQEIIEFSTRNSCFKIRVLSKEYQHTCPSTGLMLWESARLMASILASNPELVSNKRVLELGCGCSAICSMIAAKSAAETMVATDGDQQALDLLAENVASNLESPFLESLLVHRLKWGCKQDIEAIKKLNEKGFDIIIGTDVTYIPEAIEPLFATARELISTCKDGHKGEEPALILCHVFRRVDESSIISAALANGFRLVDKWSHDCLSCESPGGIIGRWFSSFSGEVVSTALNIMYFQIA